MLLEKNTSKNQWEHKITKHIDSHLNNLTSTYHKFFSSASGTIDFHKQTMILYIHSFG